MFRSFVLLILSAFFSCFLARSQDFSFVNNSTTLIKTTIQTPAHWYLECVNHTDHVLNLRWKATLDHTPESWVIELNDQTQNTVNIQTGDERDFELEVAGEFPMKLIISAHLNGTSGFSGVYFDVWDPLNPSYVETIVYYFQISPNILGLDELTLPDFFHFNNGQLTSANGEPLTVSVYNLLGELLMNEVDVLSCKIPILQNEALSFVTIQQGNKMYQLKLAL